MNKTQKKKKKNGIASLSINMVLYVLLYIDIVKAIGRSYYIKKKKIVCVI